MDIYFPLAQNRPIYVPITNQNGAPINTNYGQIDVSKRTI